MDTQLWVNCELKIKSLPENGVNTVTNMKNNDIMNFQNCKNKETVHEQWYICHSK